MRPRKRIRLRRFKLSAGEPPPQRIQALARDRHPAFVLVAVDMASRSQFGEQADAYVEEVRGTT